MADADDAMVLERRPVELAASAQFRVPKRQYTLQYAQLYYQRLATLRPAALAEAARRWGDRGRHVGKVLDVAVGERCYVVGTVYADMPLKPNILDEITSTEVGAVARAQRATQSLTRLLHQRHVLQAPLRPKYVSDKDKVLLEDDSGRLSLAGDRLQAFVLCTGARARGPMPHTSLTQTARQA
jgi:DNA polymerase delta subunit 2